MHEYKSKSMIICEKKRVAFKNG